MKKEKEETQKLTERVREEGEYPSGFPTHKRYITEDNAEKKKITTRIKKRRITFAFV